MADLVSTVGGATSNSFISTDDADVYLDARLNASAWSGASSGDKDRALIQASRELSLLCWKGSRVSSTQALAWPRSWVINPDSAFTQDYYSESVIPDRVKNATCEYALELLKAGDTDITSQDSSREVISETVGPISVTYASPSQKAAGISRFPNVTSGLSQLLDSYPNGQIRLIRG